MIRLDNVTKIYGEDTVAVRDVSFDIGKGDFVFLVGPSGSGKSTLLRLMNRQERPERGDVWIAGRNINELPDSRVPYLRRGMGNVFQDYKLLSNKTVFENVAFALEVIGKPRHVIRQQVPTVLDLVGLADKEDRFPDQLSGGEQQRVSIARAFVNRPLIMLADEPTGNLDPATGEGIMQLLDAINRSGTTVVMATHDHRMVNLMRKRVIQLDRGVMVRDQERGVYEYCCHASPTPSARHGPASVATSRSRPRPCSRPRCPFCSWAPRSSSSVASTTCSCAGRATCR